MRSPLPLAVTLFAATALVAACMTPSPSSVPFSAAPAPDHDVALVYLFRSDPPGSAKLPMININRRPVVALQGAEYSAVYVRAGTHSISVDEVDASPLVFEARGGSVHALVLEFRPTASQDIYVDAKQGKVAVPQGSSPTRRSYAWTFTENVESSNRFAELKERAFKRTFVVDGAAPAPAPPPLR